MGLRYLLYFSGIATISFLPYFISINYSSNILLRIWIILFYCSWYYI